MSRIDSPAVDWLLGSREPAVRFLTRRDVLGEEVEPDPEKILSGPWVRTLLAGQQADGGFGERHPYRKWTGAHWRLISLVELAAPPGEPRLLAAAERELAWLTHTRRRNVKVIDGLVRRCASLEGNGLAVCCRLGIAEDERVELLARSLVEWQWPDGGWNCDRRPHVTHSSFNETWGPILGLAAYGAKDAAAAGAEFLLAHGVVFSHRTGELAHPTLEKLRFPAYWHYGLVPGLRTLEACGRLDDERVTRALELLESRRLPDGTWRVDGKWWKRPGSKGSNVEAVDWGDLASEMLTEQALRILESAGRL